MFGYVNIDKGELKVKDYESYKAVYCSLCKTLGKEYTFLSRFLLSYDMTYFAMLLMSGEDGKLCSKKGRCRFNPAKTCNYLLKDNTQEPLSKASALTVITAYYKLRDNIDDSGFFLKLPLYLLLPFMKAIKKKASRKYPAYAKICGEMYASQKNAESQKLSIDECAEPTAHFLAEILSVEAKDDNEERIYLELGYHLGKWIYLADAADDFEKDLKKKRFNPLVSNVSAEREEALTRADELMSQSLCLLTAAHSLLCFKHFGDVLDNIILLGLRLRQQNIIYPEKGKRK